MIRGLDGDKHCVFMENITGYVTIIYLWLHTGWQKAYLSIIYWLFGVSNKDMGLWPFTCGKIGWIDYSYTDNLFLNKYEISQVIIWGQMDTLLHISRSNKAINIMMTSSNGNFFRFTGLLCREFTGDWWFPLTKASDAQLWCLLWSAPWINSWVNNREAGDLRRHHAHYDITVMMPTMSYITLIDYYLVQFW